MASVALDFVPPVEPNIDKLHIYEAPARTGPWTLIETVNDIGTHPDYISRYTTNVASSSFGWFSIEWEDDKGARSPMSQPIQGGQTSVVADVVRRVMLREPGLDENVVVEDVEAVTEAFFKTNPYLVDATTVSYRTLLGLTNLALARLYVTRFLTESSESYTAGLVSQKADTTKVDLERLVSFLTKQANKDLGISNAHVLMLTDIDPTGLGTTSSISWDHSRQAVTVNYE
jgi:hypothetical protein